MTEVVNSYAHFLPGSGIAFVGTDALALLEIDPNDSLVAEIWTSVIAGASVDELLEVLLRGGLRSLPSFAVAGVEGTGVRVAVRGGVTVSVRSPGADDLRLSGDDVKTWAERLVNGATEVECRLADHGGPTTEERPAGEAWFVVQRGVVPAGAVDWRPAGSLGVSGLTPRAELVPATPPLDGQVGPRESDVVDPSIVEIDPFATIAPLVSDPETEVEAESDVAENGLAPSADGTDGDKYDQLFGATRYRSVEGAAIRDDATEDDAELISSVPSSQPEDLVVPPLPAPIGVPTLVGVPTLITSPDPPLDDPSGAVAAVGDHDGMTMSRAQLEALQREQSTPPRSDRAAPGVAAASPSSPTVLAVRCVLGHPNAPLSAVCRWCGGEVADPMPSRIARPSLGLLRFSDGSTQTIDSPMVIGRAPKLEGAISGETPRLVKVSSPDGDISRVHVELAIEDWQVRVMDRSVNGTTVTLPGRPPQRLHPRAPFLIVPGSVIHLSEDLTIRYELDPGGSAE